MTRKAPFFSQHAWLAGFAFAMLLAAPPAARADEPSAPVRWQQVEDWRELRDLWLYEFSDHVAGLLDDWSGITRPFREWAGVNDAVDFQSEAYKQGAWVGFVVKWVLPQLPLKGMEMVKPFLNAWAGATTATESYFHLFPRKDAMEAPVGSDTQAPTKELKKLRQEVQELREEVSKLKVAPRDIVEPPPQKLQEPKPHNP